jgi:GNAT superfamily N-acetyltransferase
VRLLSPATVEIRAAKPSDIAQLLLLMQALAEFEHYLDDFAVDANALEQRAFGAAPECQIFVAAAAGKLLGYAVALEIAYTYDLRPTIRLKELYVAANQRSTGLGRGLLQHTAQWAVQRGAGRLHWDVLAGNQRAEQFYQALGGAPERKWINYSMSDQALQQLAQGIN